MKAYGSIPILMVGFHPSIIFTRELIETTTVMGMDNYRRVSPARPILPTLPKVAAANA